MLANEKVKGTTSSSKCLNINKDVAYKKIKNFTNAVE
jgi:HKD family nuclease